ncbi:MAG: 3-deoxy-D-manno-octulosonic acid transferase, partial [Candidatus Abyssobacteria bacterium SURF_5]
VASQLFSQTAATAYFPLDFRWVVGRILSRVRPRVVVLFETEIWPNFINSAISLGIPVVVVNGRISEASFRYYRLLPWIFRNIFARISRIGMQSGADAERAVALGAKPDAVFICGNMKFDAVSEPPSAERIEAIRRELLLPRNASLIVGGSTHQGEEKALVNAYKRLLDKKPDTRLLIAPRHPERFDEVEVLIRSQGFDVLRRSRCSSKLKPPASNTVILLDTIGELAQVYALSTISFVGGSLANVGGHNIIEPAAVAKAIVFGPHMHHFKDIKEIFLSEQAAIMVSSEDELYERLRELLHNPERIRAIGDAALRVVERNRGATERYFAFLKDFL